MAGEWRNEKSIAMVREMAMAGSGNTAIAAAVTKAFGVCVNNNMIAGAINRMGGVPKRHNPYTSNRSAMKDIFDWVTGDKPVWGTAEADAVTLEARKRWLSAYRIGDYFGVHHNVVLVRIRDLAVARRGVEAASEDPELLRFIPYKSVEWPPTVMLTVSRYYDEGLSYQAIADRLGPPYSRVSVLKKIERLIKARALKRRERILKEAPPPKPVRVRAAAVPKIAVPKTRPPPKVPVVAHLPDHKPGQSAFSGRGMALAWVDRVPTCAWSGCGKPAAGKWCHHHEQLLRAPASEISQRLAEWK